MYFGERNCAERNRKELGLPSQFPADFSIARLPCLCLRRFLTFSSVNFPIAHSDFAEDCVSGKVAGKVAEPGLIGQATAIL
jgi:hypothetical protein